MPARRSARAMPSALVSAAGRHRREEVAARLVEMIGEGRRAGVDRLVALILAVEDAQGIALQALARVLRELVDMRRVIVDQHLAIGRAALRIAERIKLQ